MCIAGVRSSGRTALRITNGRRMKYPVLPVVLNVVVLSVCVLVTGCSTTLPVGGTGTAEPRVQTAPVVRDRGLEVNALRTEMAATKIAAAKKEAELQELRDLVQQLRLENAESRQAYLELRERAELRETEQTKKRDEQEQAVQSQTTHHLAILKDTVAALAQEMGQLRQEVVRSVEKESAKASMSSLDRSITPGSQGLRTDQPKRLSSTSKTPQPMSTLVPTILMVQKEGDVTPPSFITVQSGETLHSLAQRHHTSVALLQALNQLKGEALLAGQVLRLPLPAQP